jgi:predicted Fe-S protein YdhL (DUF1289 family)
MAIIHQTNMQQTYSPCTGQCVISDNLCLGCFRLLHELKGWYKLDDSQKIKINTDARKRKYEYYEKAT